MCILCKKEYNKGHYKKDIDKYKARTKKSNRERTIELREYILAYLEEHPCVSCGEKDPVVLEFDHIVPEDKEFNISAGLTKKKTLEKIKLEVKKCQVLCANCHRRKTASDYNWYKL